MTEYTVVLKNGHCFRVSVNAERARLYQHLSELRDSLEDDTTFQFGDAIVDIREVAAIYPAENDVKGGPKMPTSDIRPRTAV